MLNQLHADFERSSESVLEVMVRLASDVWVVGRKADAREFFVMIDNTNANLSEVTGALYLSDKKKSWRPPASHASSEEVRKLSHTHFNNIFLDWL